MRARSLALPLVAFAALLVLAALIGAAPTSSAEESPRAGAAQDPSQADCTPLDDAALVAQVLGAPVAQPTLDAATAQMAQRHVGTIVLLGGAIRDAGQVRGLIADLNASGPPGLAPLIAVDEEGGRVARFGRAGVTVHLPSARTQAETSSTADVRLQALGLGQQLAALGVDYNLAPVLDLSGGPAGGIIGDRSYSLDPVLAGEYGDAFAAGMREAGVATSAKHFPDHGLTTVDTHTDVATAEASLQQLRDVHLQPYHRALPELDSIMLSHLRIDALDPQLPVSLSAPAIRFLRDELGYDRVVVTDDLSMRAVAAVANQETAALMAITAGADLALVGSVPAAQAAHTRILQALHAGELSALRLHRAASRVLHLKGVDGPTAACLVGRTHYVRR
ncbi:hypothetical protein BH23ACT9_BH23ACT9_37260 [soil metagenome]